ncbi:MAG: ASKHA domain-containing protein [Terriglobales bacterium]
MKREITVQLTPLGTSFELNQDASLIDALTAYGVEFPCGGFGLCGGCRIRLIQGTLEPTPQDEQIFTAAEIAAGWRLGCSARPRQSIKIAVEQWSMPVLSDELHMPGSSQTGVGIAIDLGTTTIVAQMIDLGSEAVLGVRTALNPQSSRGADLMSRVRYALQHQSLTSLIRRCVGGMVEDLARGRESELREIILVGNTAMHHLFAGLDVEPLSHVPFESANLGMQVFAPLDLDWNLPSDCRIRFLPCIGGFVGSDILAGILAVNMPRKDRFVALIDLGTNGEIVLGNRERILCASTAAGPAFEAASMRMGMRAAIGAITHVTVRSGKIRCNVMGNVAPRGICGSGLVDAVAAGLDLGLILPSGKLANGISQLIVSEPVALIQSDIRQLQLAKAAVAAGLRILLSRWGATFDDLATIYLAGAFGNYVRADSAERIGLLEVPRERIVPVGNSALHGAKMTLRLGIPQFSAAIEHVPLAANSNFESEFVNCMRFPVRTMEEHTATR